MLVYTAESYTTMFTVSAADGFDSLSVTTSENVKTSCGLADDGASNVGDTTVTSTVNGITYQFSSATNKNLFDAEPEKYIPAYGGWCAYAVAESSTKMEPDPTMWQIQDGKLLLFYDDWMTSLTGSLKEEWNSDQAGYKERADDNWVTVE